MKRSLDHLEVVLDYLRDEVRPRIVKMAGIRSCLQTTAVVDHVLRGLGYSPQTLGVVVQVFNEVAVAQAARGEAIDLSAPGLWARQIGTGVGSRDGWEGAGHVVNVVPEFGLLIDLSIDQVGEGHPEDPAPREIKPLPFYSTPPGDRLKAMRWGRKPLTMIGDGDNGKPYMLTYIGMPEDKSYRTAPVYNEDVWKRLAGVVLENLAALPADLKTNQNSASTPGLSVG